MAELLGDEEIDAGLEASLWEREGGAIHRDWTFANFAEALGFVNRIGAAAEERNHHPDILLHGWNKVRLTLTTHSAGGVTRSDLDMARVIDDLG